MSGVKQKDPCRQLQGAKNKAQGQRFEERLNAAFDYYRDNGFALVEKTPEPMKPLKNLGHGRFTACFEKSAQPDYKGVLRGGRAVMFEAKFTATDRVEQGRVTPEQAASLEQYQTLGARCFVVAGFVSGAVYRLPWDVWKDMKNHFGHKYISEKDQALAEFRVQEARNGLLLILN